MNIISEQILQAASILVDEKISQLNYDITVEATIDSLVNLDIGEYKVKYNGNIFSAFSSNLNYKYQVEDRVYLKIPEGDLSKKKFIENKVNDKSLSESDLNDLSNSISPVGPTLDVFYQYSKEDIFGVVAGAPLGDEKSYSYIFKGPDEYSNLQYHSAFQQYANNYELIQISANFKTIFQNVHTQGNYGVEITFYTKDKDASYRLDINAFNGNPYKFNAFNKQTVIIKIPKNYLLGLKSIKLFEEKFEYDRQIINGEVSNIQNTTKNNIFVKDIQVQYIEQKNLIDNLYYLRIYAPMGNLLTEKIPSVQLKGQLIYNGESILNKDNGVCDWYKRDLSVLIGSADYDKNAGFGWKKINADFNILNIDKNIVPYRNQYKLITTYNKSIVIAEEATVSNYDTEYDIEIIQDTEGEDIKLFLKNKKSSEQLVGNWYFSLPDGSYNLVEEGQKKNSISVKNYLTHSAVTFYCEVYDKVQKNIIATEDYAITNSESPEDLTITYIGEDNFKYDANGDITIEDSEKERTLQCQITWKEGFGTAYRVEWVSPDGTLISIGEKYNPNNSMIENLWIDNLNILHYTIKQKYQINYNNNTITIKIITLDGQEYKFQKEILFLKDGDQGTNGTTYIAAIRPCNIEGNKLSGLQPLLYQDKWSNTLRLRAYVYKDGELINNNPSYNLTYKWTGINLSSTDEQYNTQQIVVKGNDINIKQSLLENKTSDLEFYIKVQISIKDSINNNSTELYSLYPIDVIVGEMSPLTEIDINSIPSYVKYTSSGINPSFYSNNITFNYKNIDYTKNIISLNENVLQIKDKEDGRYLSPASKFFFETNDIESNIGVLQCKVDENNYLLHSIIMYLDTYGNEAINGWDGTKLDFVDDNGEKTSLFAPQIGAGKKDSYNRFTGVIMGKDSGQKKIGLYGYQDGLNTFGLLEDGTAFFGARSMGGRIDINGKTASISGGNGGSNANGMTITLANLNPTSVTKAIQIGANKFYVQYDGKLYAENAQIKGKITADELIAKKKGTIANFTFDQNGMRGGSIECDYLEANTGGSIGGWEISSDRLSSIGANTVLHSNGDIDVVGSINIFKNSNNSLGTIGEVIGSDSDGVTNNIGISTDRGDRSIILQSARNIGLKPQDGTFIEGNRLFVTVPKQNQHGIYAQFAD